MRLIFSNGAGIIDNGVACWPILELPTFSFVSEGVFYDDTNAHFVKYIGAGQSELNDDERAEIASVIKYAEPPEPEPPSFEQLEQLFLSAVQAFMEDGAKAAKYDTLLSACSYAAVPNIFQAESISFLVWRSSCWDYCHSQIELIKDGKRTIPDIADFLLELPTRILP